MHDYSLDLSDFCIELNLKVEFIYNGQTPAITCMLWQGIVPVTSWKGHFKKCFDGLRAVPELNYPQGGAQFFSDPSIPRARTNMDSEPPPRPPGHVSALINPPHYGSNMPWPPGQVTPTPRTHCQQNSINTPPPHRTKKCLRPHPTPRG